MRNDSIKYFVGLASNYKIGSKTILKLDKYFNGIENLWKEKNYNIINNLKINSALKFEITNTIRKVNIIEEFDRLDKLNIIPVSIKDKHYPELLKQIPDPPALLYVKGNLDCLSNISVAVVGSRKYTTYGRRVVRDFVRKLVNSGITIISGLALGIDTIAHREALNANGITIGVLACGLDNVYPSSNKGLAEALLMHSGAIISEYPPGVLAYKSNFPLRNRIIAGMSLGTLIIEAAKKSGTLLTAKATINYNRELFVVPGDIYSLALEGANNLIKFGAHLVNSADDIISELNIKTKHKENKSKKIFADNKFEAQIIKNLSTDKPIHVDKLAKLTGMQISQLNANLVIMEMKGMVKNLGNNSYVSG